MLLIINNVIQRCLRSKSISISNDSHDDPRDILRLFREKGEIKICNDGRGIPVRKWAQDESIYIPTLIFGKLLTSDNFNDDQKRITGRIDNYFRPSHLSFRWSKWLWCESDEYFQYKIYH